MKILNRYIKTFLYIAFSPLIILTSSVWFSTDNLGITLSSFFFYYASLVLSSFIFLYWFYFSEGELKIVSIPVFQISFFVSGVVLGFLELLILSLVCFLCVSSFLHIKREMYQLDLYSFDFRIIKDLNLLLCICFIFMIAFLCNPYTKPYLI